MFFCLTPGKMQVTLAVRFPSPCSNGSSEHCSQALQRRRNVHASFKSSMHVSFFWYTCQGHFYLPLLEGLRDLDRALLYLVWPWPEAILTSQCNPSSSHALLSETWAWPMGRMESFSVQTLRVPCQAGNLQTRRWALQCCCRLTKPAVSQSSDPRRCSWPCPPNSSLSHSLEDINAILQNISLQ